MKETKWSTVEVSPNEASLASTPLPQTPAGQWELVQVWLETGLFDGEGCGVDPRRRLRDRILARKRRQAAGKKLLACHCGADLADVLLEQV